MSNLHLKFTGPLQGSPILPASKSESNRALILNLFSGEKMKINNLSNAKDTRILQKLVENKTDVFDAGDAGTSFRFMTAYMAVCGKNAVLTGSERMKERPIQLLVDALRKLGADISYIGNEGYPPLQFNGFLPSGVSEIEIDGTVSSQYISALMMAGPCLPNGIIIKLLGDVVASWPYLELTWDLMQRIGIQGDFSPKLISIPNQEFQQTEVSIESDWSAAAYWYAMLALMPLESCLTLANLFKGSFQGDSAIQSVFENWGIKSSFSGQNLIIEKKENSKYEGLLELDFLNIPDQGQTIIALCAATGVEAYFTGLQSLAIKETNRLLAMKTELKKIGIEIEINEKEGTCYIAGNQKLIKPNSAFSTYKDHRMAMALSIFAIVFEEGIEIENPDVVEKSYPDFWRELALAEFEIGHS
jgi:3-phosphoshikimate 1-carboxyvinyltransferase